MLTKDELNAHMVAILDALDDIWARGDQRQREDAMGRMLLALSAYSSHVVTDPLSHPVSNWNFIRQTLTGVKPPLDEA